VTSESRREFSARVELRATVCHSNMDVSVRELRNHTRRVISAVESGERVVLTVHGRPVADIVPRRERSERRPSELVLADLAAVSKLAGELKPPLAPAPSPRALTARVSATRPARIE
jgi:prevent-host-death family protein